MIMKKGKMWAGIIAVFLTGLVIGFLVSRLYIQYEFMSRIERFKRDDGRHITNIILKELDDKLDLSAEQHEAIRPILEEGHRQLKKIRKEMGPRLHEIMDTIKARIKENLTTEQQEKFETELRDEFLRKPGPPPFPGGFKPPKPPKKPKWEGN